MDADQTRQLEKLVKLVLDGVSDTEIAQVMAVSFEEMQEIQQLPVYKETYARLYEDKLLKNAAMDDGWDSLERVALTNINEVMRFNKNPDFLLKAALVANKAMRRESKNRPLDPQAVGPRAVINLNQTFIQKINNSHVSVTADRAEPTCDPRPQIEHDADPAVVSSSTEMQAVVKRSNYMLPGSVETLLGRKPEIADFDMRELHEKIAVGNR